MFEERGLQVDQTLQTNNAQHTTIKEGDSRFKVTGVGWFKVHP